MYYEILLSRYTDIFLKDQFKKRKKKEKQVILQDCLPKLAKSFLLL